VATLVVACVSYIGQWLLPPRTRTSMAVAALAVLVTFHAWQAVQFYWDDAVQVRDWNRSWNDESYLAAQWLAANTPEDALVGSWNAGVLGYYSGRRVVNLDGLINHSELLPYLENETIADYIKQKRLRYVSDLNPMFERYQLTEQIKLTEVYSHYNELTRQHYRIYRVDE
jgi:hypothetical protein